MILHVRRAFEDRAAGVMTALCGLDPVFLGGVFDQVFAVGTLEGAALLETRRSAVQSDVVCLHVSLQRPAAVKAPAAGGTEKLLTARCLLRMHAGHVAADGVALHGGVTTQVAAVGLLPGLPQTVDAQLAPAGEETVAGGTLEAGIGEVQPKVLLEVGAHLEAASAFGTGVGAINVLGSLRQIR